MNKQELWTRAALPLIGLALAASMAGNAQAQSVAPKDKAWMEKSARDGAAEVQAGKLAAAKAASPAVKRFGEQMVADHGKAGEELKGIAARKGLTLPEEPDQKHKDALAKLEKLSGDKFDKEYVKSAGLKDHQAAEKHFKDGARNLQDPDAKAFAAKTLPTIQHHLMMVKEMK